jgi:predicted O-methyltransferase YrrM
MGPLRRQRSRAFRRFSHNRFWWHTLEATDHAPTVYAALSTREWLALLGWYRDTHRNGRIGEVNVPAMGLMHGLIVGSGLRRIVQLGHFQGYSALLLGSMLKQMGGRRPGLVSFDIDADSTAFAGKWLRRAGVSDRVVLHTGDSAAPDAPERARAALGGPPELVFVDSSHQYAHTLSELDLWVAELPVGGLVLLHDTSEYARSFDATGQGGVARALEEWVPRHPEVTFANLNGFVPEGADVNVLAYKDGCGLGVLQRVA